MSFLLDTNVISEIRKPRRDERVAAWFAEANSNELFLSALVVGEIRQGIERLRRRRDRRQANIFDAWLARLREEFAERLLPISIEVAERWGRLDSGRRLPVIDGLLVATALEHDLTFVTRESERLVGTGARLLDPWQA